MIREYEAVQQAKNLVIEKFYKELEFLASRF